MSGDSWKCYGVSVTGPAHKKDNHPNQDCFTVYTTDWGEVVVVSDGVGSCALSHIGSQAACQAVLKLAEKWAAAKDPRLFESFSFINTLYSYWKELIGANPIEQCCATCLFVIHLKFLGQMVTGQIGDGLIGLERTGEVVFPVLRESREFSNITNCLNGTLNQDNWYFKVLPDDEMNSVVLMTDGVADDLSDPSGFVTSVAGFARAASLSRFEQEMTSALDNWPTPKHRDDKTVVCLFRS